MLSFFICPLITGNVFADVAPQKPPNIVMIVVDDMRFDEFGKGGHPFLETPNCTCRQMAHG